MQQGIWINSHEAVIGNIMPLLNILTSDTIYNLARGPFVWAAFVIFFAGCLIRTLQILSLTKKWEPNWNIPVSMGQNTVPIVKSPFRIKLSIFGTSPMTMMMTILFHILIFISPIFLYAHNILLKEATGISLFSFSQQNSNALAFSFLGCSIFFLFRRVFFKRVRVLSTMGDYLILLIVVAPFLTGLLAFYQIYNYKAMVILHMLSGEFMLIAIPSTKIFHMVFFFMGRFLLVGQNSLVRGTRIL